MTSGHLGLRGSCFWTCSQVLTGSPAGKPPPTPQPYAVVIPGLLLSPYLCLEVCVLFFLPFLSIWRSFLESPCELCCYLLIMNSP